MARNLNYVLGYACYFVPFQQHGNKIVQSSPLNKDTEGAIESVRINGVSVGVMLFKSKNTFYILFFFCKNIF